MHFEATSEARPIAAEYLHGWISNLFTNMLIHEAHRALWSYRGKKGGAWNPMGNTPTTGWKNGGGVQF